MKTAYITEQGATVRRNGHVLEVWTGRKKRAELLVHDLDQLVLMGNIMVTPAVLDFVIAEKVDTVFMSIHGRFRGRLMHAYSKNVRLRHCQYSRLADGATALHVARSIVRGKINNSRTFLLRAARRREADERLTRAADRLRAMASRLDEMEDLAQVRGCEGRAAAIFFEAFPALLLNSEFEFNGRNRRPPRDPINVLLSLGYTLLANSVETAVQIVGLDPYLGALHEVAYGRPSLVCDLMEEYRAVIVDPLVVSCVNKRVFCRDDFEERGDGEPVSFDRDSMRRFIRLFEKRVRDTVVYEPRGIRLAYRQVMEEQARAFARFVLGDEEEYRPLVIR